MKKVHRLIEFLTQKFAFKPVYYIYELNNKYLFVVFKYQFLRRTVAIDANRNGLVWYKTEDILDNCLHNSSSDAIQAIMDYKERLEDSKLKLKPLSIYNT